MPTLLHGNILEAEAEALVNTVNTVGVMGKGIALQFKKAFPENYRAYVKSCKEEDVQVGRMFTFDRGELSQPKFIINFPTKRHWREKSKLEYVEEGLKDLIDVVKDLGIGSIAIPPLGCGNGGLDWEVVRPMIFTALEEVPEVNAIIFEPAPFDSDQIKVEGPKPRLTPNRASLLKLVSEYLSLGNFTLGKLEIQKLLYFLQVSGQPLTLKFIKHHFGPYDQAVEHVLDALDQHYIVGFGDRSSRSRIRLKTGALEEAEATLSSDKETQERLEKVLQLIEGFETSYGIELLATVHWIITQEAAQNDDEIFEAVQSWSDRKRELFEREHVVFAAQHLREYGFDQLRTQAPN